MTPEELLKIFYGNFPEKYKSIYKLDAGSIESLCCQKRINGIFSKDSIEFKCSFCSVHFYFISDRWGNDFLQEINLEFYCLNSEVFTKDLHIYAPIKAPFETKLFNFKTLQEKHNLLKFYK